MDDMKPTLFIDNLTQMINDSQEHVCLYDGHLFTAAQKAFLAQYLSNFQSSTKLGYTILGFSICVFGIVSNLIHLIVLSRTHMRNNSVNRLLTAVSICDLGTVISYLGFLSWANTPVSCAPGFSLVEMRLFVAHAFLCVYLHSTSLWLVVCIALVRRMTLRKVRTDSFWMKTRCANRLTKLCFVMLLVFAMPIVFVHNIVPISTNTTSCDITEQRYTVSLLGENRDCRTIKIYLWVGGVICKILPCILLSVLSAGLVYHLCRRNRRRQSLLRMATPLPPLLGRRRRPKRRKQRQHQRTTLSVILIVVVFLITEFPQGVLTILGAICTEEFYFIIYAGLADFMDLLSLVNSSVNFLIYCLTSSAYRKTFLGMFRLRMTPPAASDGSTMNRSLMERLNGTNVSRLIRSELFENNSGSAPVTQIALLPITLRKCSLAYRMKSRSPH